MSDEAANGGPAAADPAGATPERESSPSVDDAATGDELPESAAAEPGRAAEVHRWRRTRWVFTRRLCFGGYAGALVLFCLSFTPSLVPRAWLFQGAVSGVSLVIGCGLGSALSAGIRKLISSEPSPEFKRIAWRVLWGGFVVLGVLFVWLGSLWQEDVRRLMEMDQLAPYESALILLLSVVLAWVILVTSRAVRLLARGVIGTLERWIPRWASMTAGTVIVLIVVLGLIQGLLLDPMVSAVNSTYSLSDRDTSPWISQPASGLRSGGPGSLVEWDTLGQKGRDFTGDGGGPTAADIEAFTGQPAMEPIRVYVGLDSASSLEERVDLAIRELERAGAFNRSVLVVNTTTGTGWVDENVADSIEFLHGGDTAQVAMQYSFLPSWVSFLVDRSKAADAGREMINAVADRIAELPEDARPQFLLFGESLGSYGTEAAFDDLDELLDRSEGALLVGPTFVNDIHTAITDGRDAGSPSWRPVLDGGSSVRTAVDPADLTEESLYEPGVEWARPRVVYLQNSSDPITYFNPELLYSPPDWVDDPRGPDVSDSMIWVPIVTFWQVAADMAFSMDVPAGHGHRYGSNVVDGWVQLSAPDGWSDDDTAALRELIDARAEERTKRKEADG